jgi:hypothetical protein
MSIDRSKKITPDDLPQDPTIFNLASSYNNAQKTVSDTTRYLDSVAQGQTDGDSKVMADAHRANVEAHMQIEQTATELDRLGYKPKQS